MTPEQMMMTQYGANGLAMLASKMGNGQAQPNGGMDAMTMMMLWQRQQEMKKEQEQALAQQQSGGQGPFVGQRGVSPPTGLLSQFMGGGVGAGGAYSTTQAAAPAGGLAQSLGVAAVPGGIGNAAGAGGAASATGSGGSAGGAAGAGAFANPYMLIPAAVAAGKMYESKNPDSPISRASLSLAGPSIAQMWEDPKLAATTAAGIPFINGLIRSDKAAKKKPEWMFWT